MSATPATVAGRTLTRGRLRKLFAATVSSASRTTSVGSRAPHFASSSAARFVPGSSNVDASSTAIEPRAACTDSAPRSARRRAFRFTFTLFRWGFGPNATPPPRRCGTLSGPARARPVPFWRHAFAPVIDTSPRPSVEAVPRRRAAASARATSCTSEAWSPSPKISPGRLAFDCWPSTAALGAFALAIASHLHRAVLWPRHRAPQEQQVPLRIDVEHFEPALGDAPAAHTAGHAQALEDARRVRAGADRARRAHVVGSMRLRAARVVVPADGALEALADGDARDLHPLAGLELADPRNLADLRALF